MCVCGFILRASIQAYREQDLVYTSRPHEQSKKYKSSNQAAGGLGLAPPPLPGLPAVRQALHKPSPLPLSKLSHPSEQHFPGGAGAAKGLTPGAPPAPGMPPAPAPPPPIIMFIAICIIAGSCIIAAIGLAAIGFAAGGAPGVAPGVGAAPPAAGVGVAPGVAASPPPKAGVAPGMPAPGSPPIPPMPPMLPRACIICGLDIICMAICIIWGSCIICAIMGLFWLICWSIGLFCIICCII